MVARLHPPSLGQLPKDLTTAALPVPRSQEHSTVEFGPCDHPKPPAIGIVMH